jgi:hypothetical protein
MDSHGSQFETQRKDENAGGHVVAVVEEVGGTIWPFGGNRIDCCRGCYNRYMSTPDPEPVDPNQVRSGPIRNESLPPELLEHVQAVYDVIEPYLDTTLEQFEINFMRDMHPEDDVFIWASITAAWMDYHKQHLDDELLSEKDEKELFAALIAISTGVKDAGTLDVPADVGKKLLACYDALKDELE